MVGSVADHFSYVLFQISLEPAEKLSVPNQRILWFEDLVSLVLERYQS